jgi:hypothetical protein
LRIGGGLIGAVPSREHLADARHKRCKQLNCFDWLGTRNSFAVVPSPLNSDKDMVAAAITEITALLLKSLE